MEKLKINKRNFTRFQIYVSSILVLFFSVVLLVMSIMKVKVFNTLLPYGLGLIIVLLCTLLFTLYRFLHAIEAIDHNANLLSQGKLNISDIQADRTKGVETLSIAFNEMKRNLMSFIESTKSNVITLSDAVDKVTKSLDMSYKGNEQIAANMATVAEKAQDQLKIARETLDSIQEVSQRANNITSTLANIEKFVENTVQISSEGSDHLDKYNDQIMLISTNLKDTWNFIDTLNLHLQEIDQVGGLIINITEQLKLLSLNSAVEAARAGEAGKGFVVVAQEMNKLSNATRESIGQINRLLANIMNSNAKVSASISNVSESFDTSTEIFASVKDSFYSINTNANILNEDMKKVYEESQMIYENTKTIGVQGTMLYDASNEISCITQDVAAVTEEELAENEEINNQALSLKQMLTGIEVLLKRYKTSITPVDQDSTKKLKILMMSPLDHPFWRMVRQGALFAKNELKGKNVDVDYVGYEYMNNENFLADLDQKLEIGYDGIIIPGYVAGITKSVEKAHQLGVPVIAFNCDLPEGTDRLTYFGPNIEAAATKAGELVVKCADGEGEVAMISGRLDTGIINRVRRDCVLSVINKSKKVKLTADIQIDEIKDNVIYEQVLKTLKENPNIKVIVPNSGSIQSVCRAIKDAGNYGKTFAICYDYDQEIIELIKQGYVYAAMGQDPFGQGHDPIICLYNYLVAKEVPEKISYTRTELIDKRSVSE